ncbi:MAG: CoA transferase [Gemmatimonadaceae bacterium]|nr:CoA transferase [Gemmatimonadaceae bacterium]
MQPLPLEGLKVLDLSRVLAGPLCTMMLGDLGATVIKIERPKTGDDTRGWGPPFDDRGESAYFLSVNRNKASVAADFRQPEDQALLHALASEADLVVENYLPGTLEQFGLDAASMMARYPRLLWCTISGFGPDSRRPGYDFVTQAESGWMAITGDPTGAPMKHGVALVDVITGKDAAIGLLALLVARERAAAPLPAAQRHLHVTLADSARAALVNVAQNALVSGRDARRWGNAHANLVPYQLFEAADRPFVIAVGADGQWPPAMRALALDVLADDPDLRTNAGRLAHRARVVQAIADQVRTQPATFWMTRLEAAGVPCGVVRTVQESLAELPGDVSTAARTGVPPLWNGRVRLAPPRMDEHGVSVRAKQWSFADDLPIPLSVDV